MRVFTHPDCLLHNPSHEVLGGKEVNYYESPQRLGIIRAALAEDPSFTISEELDNSLNLKEWMLEIHDPGYVDFLQDAYEELKAHGGDEVRVSARHRI